MRVFHSADVHYAPGTLEEVDRCFTAAVDIAIAENCDVAVLAGDLFDHRVELHSPAVRALIKQVSRLGNAMPLLAIAGTFSHDVPGSVDVLRSIATRFPIYVATRIEQVALIETGRTPVWLASDSWTFAATPDNTLALFSCLPSINKGAVAAAAGAENASAAVGDAVSSLLSGWAPSHRQARQAGAVTAIVAHGTVSGCETEHGVVMAGLDHEMVTGSLFAADADVVMLGHIHKHQVWRRGGQVIAYPGSVGRLHFGERDPKGFLVWEILPGAADFTFHETPAKRLVEIDFTGTPDMDALRAAAADATGAHVRVRFSVDEDHRASVDRKAIAELFAGAAAVKIEGRINPVQRTRAAGIGSAHSLAQRLQQWCEITQSDPAPLVDRLAELEARDVAEIVKELP
jgi:exonuclease SbcD